MALITVDQERCTQDGHCVAECPAKIIFMINETPIVPEEAETYCIDCGHCVAVCPQEALSLKTLDPKSCLPVEKSLKLDPEATIQFLRSRRSIRSFKEKSVDRELLQKAIDIARFAPSASNRQPVHWLVLEQEESVKKVTDLVADWMRYMIKTHPEMAADRNFDKIVESHEAGIDRICRHARHLVFCYADKSQATAETDCAIALTYLELALPALGLGDCWGGYVNFASKWWPPLKEFLGIPENMDVYAVAMVGYPKFRYHRMPERNPAPVLWR